MKPSKEDFKRWREEALEATPGQWTYDWDNWEVEGPRPRRRAAG